MIPTLSGAALLRTRTLRAPWVPQPNAANSTVVSGAQTLVNDGVQSCTVTVTVLDGAGHPIVGITPVISVTGTGNTVTQPPAPTNLNGVAVGSFVSTNAEVKTISATANGLSITQTASCTVTGGSGGTVGTFTAVNRDTLAAAGGETLIATVSSIVGTPSNPTVNGVTAILVSVVDSTHISFVTPALTAGGPYSITLGGQTLSNCVTVMAAITTTFRTANFDDGTSGNWALTDNWISGSGGSHAFSTDFVLNGSAKSLKTIIASGGDSQLHYAFADNRPLLETNGVFVRFFVLLPDATVTLLTASGANQQKFHLCRKDINTNPPSWGMVGCGSAFAGSKLTLVRDAGTTTAYSSTFAMGTTTGWVEVQLGYNRKGGTGTLTLWLNGVKVFSETATTYGSDTTTDIFYPRIGAVFSTFSGTANSYFENCAVANGYIGSNA